MATTTAQLIRDRAVTVVKGLTPTSETQLLFVPFRNELGANFREWAEANPAAAARRFQIRSLGTDDVVEVSNEDVETHYVDLEVVVAYPQTHRWGSDNALDRDDVMDEDRHDVENAIGLRGSANFAGSNPDATYRGHTVTREVGEACDFLVIVQRMSFARAV